MITYFEAKEIINSSIPKSLEESIRFDQSLGRTLSNDIYSLFPQPRFDNSAMDGFAVRWQDTLNASNDTPIVLNVIGVVPAGKSSNLVVSEGHCTQIMTGGKLPIGANSVIMVENTSGFESEAVKIYKPATNGQNIRYAGEEIPKDRLLIKKGTQVTPAEIGIIATFGLEYITVFKKPVVSIFGLGDELLEPGLPLEEGKIYNSNLHVISNLVKESGGIIKSSILLRDDRHEIESWFSRALQTSDVVISSAGISMGRYDYVKTAFSNLGVVEKFWKVAQKPGKPLFFGTLDNKLIFGLPGNPVSSFIGYLEYIHPVIKLMSGQNQVQKISVPLIGEYPVEKLKHRFIFGKCGIVNDRLMCKASAKTGSHMLTSSLGSNCIIDVPPSSKPVVDGEMVTVNLLSNFTSEQLLHER
ncbi:MAG: molybdopterin molybdotransferase MoeA [Candidatus Marinimicrobia bacterium]|jgi:molybdopterin molybdotransferase|nr:molybdopterin molybdotransferase MoeA [Candidatus Neomarinimicrobiota bacterium]MBT3633822.1 molybdopterin molybdotransferase MoeA [Candidatus Neomarinimicrobiota bacterium]MBT3682614.1 molybdopterin molybdotransferase MoeA [Candidatus Neomarinimicrobiota bacterium]MBT3759378.1 molybdopterin molybdotransferase MoeA [Candidatus Neomarinimicrobiota bacterium]MBT3894614.1 molybdopterin molybdotransferase MoeA [Candidatus Neomarinimicrobiota bacterium]